MSTSARFERLPAYDIRACCGCGDDAAVPTEAYIDHVTGDIVHCYCGDTPGDVAPAQLANRVWERLPEPTAEDRFAEHQLDLCDLFEMQRRA